MFSESVLAGLPFPSRKSFRVILLLKMCWNRLNTVSPQCARGKSFIARKREVHSKIFKW